MLLVACLQTWSRHCLKIDCPLLNPERKEGTVLLASFSLRYYLKLKRGKGAGFQLQWGRLFPSCLQIELVSHVSKFKIWIWNLCFPFLPLSWKKERNSPTYSPAFLFLRKRARLVELFSPAQEMGWTCNVMQLDANCGCWLVPPSRKG